MTTASRQGGRGPELDAGARTRRGTFPALSWWFVAWRARVLDESTGNAEARLAAVASALDHLGEAGGQPVVRLLTSGSVSIEFWYQAVSAREAFGGARAAIRRACRAAGVGDPIPPTGTTTDVMLMLEELPSLHRDGPTRSGY